MTITLRAEKVNGFYITIQQEKFDQAYNVQICRMYDELHAGYPISENYYATWRQANARFNYLKRKVVKDTNA